MNISEAVNKKVDKRVEQALKDGFYGTMYGQPFWSDVGVVYISGKSVDMWKDGSMCYVWGYPGPDYNRYTPEDYGKTWVLTEKETEAWHLKLGW